MDDRIKVGTKVFVESTRGQSAEVRDGVISKVGRKYFEVTVAAGGNYTYVAKFHIDSLREVTKYSPRCALHFSMQEIEDRKERNGATLLLTKAYSSGAFSNLTLDQLRRIRAIMEEGGD